MKESYGEGLATHTGPESCAVAREGGGEALTGERAGRVFSRERALTPGRRRRGGRRKATSGASISRDAAESRAVRDPEHARTHLAREPGEPVVARRGWRGGPHREVQGRTPMMHGPRAVGQPRSTDEVPEQGRATGGGGDGGKGAGQREPEPAQRAPDTGPGRRAQCAGAGTASCGAGQAGAVHGAPAPRLQHRAPARGLLRAEAGGGAGDRRRDVAALRGGPGGEPRGPVADGWREGRIERSRSSGRTSPRPTGGSGRWASPRWKTSSSSARRSRC